MIGNVGFDHSLVQTKLNYLVFLKLFINNTKFNIFGIYICQFYLA